MICARPGLRAEVDLRNEKINYKVREHSVAKVPVILVVGKREMEEQAVNMRRLGIAGPEVDELGGCDCGVDGGGDTAGFEVGPASVTTVILEL